MSRTIHTQEHRVMALKLGVTCPHVGKGVMQALLGAWIVAVAGATTLTSSALPFATPTRLTTAASPLGFVCAGPDPLDPLDT